MIWQNALIYTYHTKLLIIIWQLPVVLQSLLSLQLMQWLCTWRWVHKAEIRGAHTQIPKKYNYEYYYQLFCVMGVYHIYLCLYDPLLGLGRFLSFLPSYTVRRTTWTGDEPVGRTLSAHRTAKHRINAHRHPCLKWDLTQRSQCFSGGRQFIPKTDRPLW
jgi:hypothetical protein